MKEYRSIPIIAALLVTAFCGALIVAHLRIQSTLIGYELGELKDKESALLERRGRLKVDLAKLTKQKNLTILASKAPKSNSEDEKSLASR